MSDISARFAVAVVPVDAAPPGQIVFSEWLKCFATRAVFVVFRLLAIAVAGSKGVPCAARPTYQTNLAIPVVLEGRDAIGTITAEPVHRPPAIPTIHATGRHALQLVMRRGIQIATAGRGSHLPKPIVLRA